MMRKLWRTTLWLLIFVILLSLPVFAAEDGGAGSLTFFVSGTPTNFKDVSSKSWYYANVREMTALGLMQGVGKDRFAPEENMEVAEAVALAARVHAVYTYASTDPVESLPVGKQWYDRYYDYLLSQGISSVAGWRNKAAEDAPQRTGGHLVCPHHFAQGSPRDQCDLQSARLLRGNRKLAAAAVQSGRVDRR